MLCGFKVGVSHSQGGRWITFKRADRSTNLFQPQMGPNRGKSCPKFATSTLTQFIRHCSPCSQYSHSRSA